jgi:hypothetical protein
MARHCVRETQTVTTSDVVLTPAFRFRIATDGSAWADTYLLKLIKSTKYFQFYTGFPGCSGVDQKTLIVVFRDNTAYELVCEKALSIADLLKALYYGAYKVWHPPVVPMPWRGLANIKTKFDPARLP